MAGSVPSPGQLSATGATTEVTPICTALSNTSNWSPLKNASVTVSRHPPTGQVNVHGGSPAKIEFAPELGVQSPQPVASTPAVVNANSCQGPPRGIATLGPPVGA